MADKEQKQVNVCWVSGNYFERRAFIKKLRGYLQGKGDYETTVFEGEETIDYCKNLIMQSSCFCDQRLFIFNEWPKYNTTAQTFYKHFVEMCRTAPDDAVIVCNNLQTESKTTLNAFEKMGKVFLFDTVIKTKDAPGWFVGRLEQDGKNISEQDAVFVVESIGETEGTYGIDIDRMNILAIKLIAYVGNRKNITPEDIFAVCTDEPSFIIWNMYNHLDNKDFEACMSLVARAELSSKNITSFVIQMVSSMIWRFRLILFLKEGSAQGWDTAVISREISNLHKLKSEGRGFTTKYTVERSSNNEEKPLYSSKMVENTLSGRYRKPPVLCYSRKEIFLILLAAEQVQAKIRSGVTDEEASILLDSLLMIACSIVEGDSFDKIRRITNAEIC